MTGKLARLSPLAYGVYLNAEHLSPQPPLLAGLAKEGFLTCEDELAALPLVYKIMLFGGVYYYGTVFRLMDNHDQLKELLEYILNQLFTDQIDFGKILAKTNK